MNLNDLKKIKCISNEVFKGKTILLRVDFNSTVKHERVIRGPKILEHMKTIRLLCEKGAKIVILSHQGRKGGHDFVSLEKHLPLLEALKFDSVKNIYFMKWDEDYLSKISSLKKGEALLLDNTRFLDFETEKKSAEEHARNPVIKALAEKADFFVLDALSVAHRSHATVVGFSALLPSFAGYNLEEEINALKKVEELEAKKNVCLVLGGLKPVEPIAIMNKMLSENKVSYVMLGGIIGELALKAKGIQLGKKDEFIKERGLEKFIPDLKELFDLYGKKIYLPTDVAVEKRAKRRELPVSELPSENQIYDVGHHTIASYCDIIENCDLIIHNGPFGVFENTQFRVGTREILETLHESKGFTLIAGGDTVTALVGLGFRKQDFSHVSLAGGAFLEYLSGRDLPGLKALLK